jgi:hypothetical protein
MGIGIVERDDINPIDASVLFVAVNAFTTPFDLFAPFWFNRIIDDQERVITLFLKGFTITNQRNRSQHQQFTPVVAGIFYKPIVGVFTVRISALLHKRRLAFVHHQHVNEMKDYLKWCKANITFDKITLFENF